VFVVIFDGCVGWDFLPWQKYELHFFSKKLGFVDFLIVVCLAGVFIVEVTEAKKSAVSRKIYSLGLIIE
jgi:hypothetical protein